MRMANVPIDVLQAVCASDNGAQKITYVYEWQMLPIHKHSFLPVDVLQAICASDNGAQKSYICILMEGVTDSQAFMRIGALQMVCASDDGAQG